MPGPLYPPLMAIDFLDELNWRGLLHQCTHEQELRTHLSDPDRHPRRAYAGFDPTADSLTIGNLVPIMLLVHLARAGHEPVVVMGGGTGLIGDPSGKSAERMLRSEDEIDANVRAQRPIFERIFEGASHIEQRDLIRPIFRNNIDWLRDLQYIRILRDIGKHFSVNMMIQKESIRERLHGRDQGISYTEFSYMILQAYDFRFLHEHERVTLQLGGSDQWGNIVAGVDLIRRMHASRNDGDDHTPDAFGLTAPLVTKADGGKFGKTESGAVWLSPERTIPYAYHQFWLNTADEDVGRFLRIFTLLPREQIEHLEARTRENPGAREAQKALAHHATALLYGEDEADACEQAARALFSGEIARLPEATLRTVLAEVPSSTHPRQALAGEGVALVDLLVETGLASSKRQAREFLQAGSITINGQRIDAGTDARLTTENLLHGSLIALRRGKKAWHLTIWE